MIQINFKLVFCRINYKDLNKANKHEHK